MAQWSILDYNKARTQAVKSGNLNRNLAPIGPSSPGFVQGTANRIQAPRGQVLGAQAPGGGGGSSPQPQNFNQNQAPYESAPEQSGIDWDALIAPALQGLEAAEGAAQGQYSAGLSEAGAARTSRTASTTQNIGAQEQTLETGRKRQQEGAESAADEARRQFAEIQQGLQARYGGTTGTGQFAGELAGRETLRGIGNIRQGLSQAMLEIDTKLQQVKEIGRIALEDIDSQYKIDQEKLKANLESELAGIRREKGQLQQWKAAKAAEAIQNYQFNVQAVEQRNTAFKQQLFMDQQAAQQRLTEAQRRGQGVAESFRVMNLSQGDITTPVRVGSQGSVLGFDGQPVNAGSGTTLFNPGTFGVPKEEEESDNPFS